jgi:hypothetical protein
VIYISDSSTRRNVLRESISATCKGGKNVDETRNTILTAQSVNEERSIRVGGVREAVGVLLGCALVDQVLEVGVSEDVQLCIAVG